MQTEIRGDGKLTVQCCIIARNFNGWAAIIYIWRLLFLPTIALFVVVVPHFERSSLEIVYVGIAGATRRCDRSNNKFIFLFNNRIDNNGYCVR